MRGGTVSALKKKRYKYRIVYTFNIPEPSSVNSIELSASIRFQRNLEPENIIIRDGSATLEFTRSKRQDPRFAINNERHLDVLNRVQCCFALIGLGVPSLEHIDLFEDEVRLGVDKESYPKLALQSHGGDAPVGGLGWRTVAPELLSRLLKKENGTCSAKALVASSYLIGSFFSRGEVERLRLLWSGFNAMYHALAGESARREFQRLNQAAAYASNGGLKRAETYYALRVEKEPEVLGQVGWYEFAKAKLSSTEDRVKLDRALCSLRFIDHFILAAIQLELSGKKAAEAKRLKLIDLTGGKSGEDVESTFPMKILRHVTAGVGDSRGGRGIALEVESSPRDEVAFLLCDYLYNLRCRYMHGESGYPLYAHKFAEKALSWLNDVLECALVDCIEAGLEGATFCE